MRALIRRLSLENVLWSAETIHGHLVLLGFDPPCPDTIRKYMAKPKGGTDKSQAWLTFLRNHLPVSWAMDFFTVPTLRFQILYLFVILNHSRRQVVHFAVTAHPTMAWVIQQLREAMPFGQQLTYLFRDNDGIYGDEVGRFLAGTGIAEVKTAHRCPWQNPFVERYAASRRIEQFRQAEVQDLHLPFARNRDVYRLQITMNDAVFVRFFQRLGNLHSQRGHLLLGKWRKPMCADSVFPLTNSIITMKSSPSWE
jgi:hypothetical protein